MLNDDFTFEMWALARSLEENYEEDLDGQNLSVEWNGRYGQFEVQVGNGALEIFDGIDQAEQYVRSLLIMEQV